ncbi:hypothetical protein FQN57_005613 [Myotisia sp. PD_48]|nr:hypothetical protein FQN57_005613 [Myotisia sp. PD_48]
MSSLFNLPFWAQRDHDKSNSKYFYRRARHVYADIIACEEDENNGEDGIEIKEPVTRKNGRSKSSKRKEHSHKSSDDDDDEDEAQDPDGDDANTTITQKRKKVKSSSPTNTVQATTETVLILSDSDSDLDSGQPNRPSRAALQSPPAGPSVSRSVRQQQQENTVNLDSDSFQPTSSPPPALAQHPPIARVPAQPTAPTVPDYESSESEDEFAKEFPELAKRARERARQQHGQTNPPPPSIPDAKTGVLPQRTEGEAPEAQVSQEAQDNQDEDDTVVELLIISDLPDTRSLLVSRKRSQTLGQVRLAWCHYQNFTPEMTKEIILTWQRRRLFDVSTCERIVSKDASTPDWAASDERRIQLEATTEELWLARRKREEAVLLGTTDEPPEEEAAVEETTLRIHLKSPTYGNVQLKVKPTSSISNIISRFRKAQRVPAGNRLVLVFDGDRLPEDSTVQDHDIEHLDSLDVMG